MKGVGIAELKARLSEYLRAARRGETITVLDRGEPVATIAGGARGGALVVRSPHPKAARLASVPLLAPLRLKADPVALLLEDRARER